MSNLKKLTLLHSNDMHGDFQAEKIDNKLVGGVSRLSGYLNKVRKEEKNVLYVISGDMFRGSLIDSEYKGLSTIEIINLLAPDCVTLGNHEIDYGLSHLLFLEKCAKFPIINANLYIKNNQVRLFKSHIIKRIGGMNVLFIGILTEEVLATTRQDKLIGSIVDVSAASKEVGKICDAYKTTDIDLTVLLTHIGFGADKELASLLDPRYGVDLIIGGHSHTKLTKPEVVNNIPIVQAVNGTDQIGRFDLTINTDTNSLEDYTWELIPITPKNCPLDKDLEKLINKYQKQTDAKYDRILTRFADKYTHPERNQETDLGKIFADALAESLGVDLMILGSGSIRKEELGPIATYGDLLEIFPYDDKLEQLTLTGAQLKKMLKFMLRDEAFSGHTEFYQLSKGIKVIYSRKKKEITSLSFNGNKVKNTDKFTVGIQDFHLNSLKQFWNLSLAEVAKNQKPRVIAVSCQNVLNEYFSNQELLKVSPETRLEII